MRALRRYRLVPSLLALSLVLTAAAPLVAPSCGMTAAEMASVPCCDGHGLAAAHTKAPEATPPCHGEPEEEPSAPCSEALTLSAACCASSDSAVALLPDRAPLLHADALALAASLLATPPATPAPPRPPGASDPPAPVALHLLYGSFLT